MVLERGSDSILHLLDLLLLLIKIEFYHIKLVFGLSFAHQEGILLFLKRFSLLTQHSVPVLPTLTLILYFDMPLLQPSSLSGGPVLKSHN